MHIGRYTTAAVPAAAKDHIESICQYDTSVDKADRLMVLGLLQNHLPNHVISCEWWIVTSSDGFIGFMLTYSSNDHPVLRGIERKELFTQEWHLKTMLHFMYVHVKHQKCGVGSRLLRMLMKKCTMQDEGIYVDCLSPQIGFFTRRAFVLTGKYKRYNRLIWAPNNLHKLFKSQRSNPVFDQQCQQGFEHFFDFLGQSEGNRLKLLSFSHLIRKCFEEQESFQKERRAQEHRQRYEMHREAEASSMRNDLKKRAETISQSRKEQVDANITARKTQLAKHKNQQTRKSKAVPTAALCGKELAKKAVSIEQVKQHAHNLKERERQRVAKLEYMMHIVGIGDAIQHGDEGSTQN